MKLSIIIALVSLSLAGLPSRLAAVEESLADLQDRAVALYQAGRYDAAIPLYRKVADAQPGSKGALKDFLIALWLGERYAEAADVGGRLIALAPKDIDAHFLYARSLLAIGDRERALTIFERCRELDPNERHIQLATARVEGLLRQYDSAIRHLEELKRQSPDYKELYPELARVQEVSGDFANASENWGKSLMYFPENRVYSFHHAQCLLYSGQRGAAMEKLGRLASGMPPYWPAIDFLADALTVQGEPAKARQLLLDHLQALRLDDEPRWIKILHLDLRQKRWKDTVADADRWLALSPNSGEVLMIKADAFRRQGAYKEAAAIYQEILRKNAASIGAWKALAQAQEADGRPREAVASIEKALRLDPGDPYLLVAKSFYLFETGERQKSRQILEQWIAGHPESPVPALLYHGVTSDPQDPILANAIHRSTASLEDHLKVLHEAGYTAITALQLDAWIHGKASLPNRPVFISFDDARLDSFRYADPLLKTYGLRATLFAPLVNVDGYLPRYASWKDLAAFRDTGRWDIQSHGDQAHEHIATDADGRQGLFLINREWLSGQKRLETEDEWSVRASKDFERSRRKIETRLGYSPIAYSFPEGNYGQDGMPNVNEAAVRNMEWVARIFGTAYHQDDYGFNFQARDPSRLTRYEPPPEQDGRSLLRHLTDQAPSMVMRRRLLREAVWEGRMHEARQQLDQLRLQGASNSCLWAEEARLRYSQGYTEKARRLAMMAVKEEDSEENQALLADITGRARFTWKGRFAYQEDNHQRISRRFRQDLGDWHGAGLDWNLHHVFGSYSEGAGSALIEHGGGAAVARNLGDFHRLSLEATGHAFDSAARNTWSMSGDLHSSWTENWSTDLEGGRGLYDTARAIRSNILRHYAAAKAQWQPETDWRASAWTRLETLSDDNQRATGVVEGGRRLLLPQLWLVGRATVDSAKNVSPLYYSPQVLQEYQVGADYTFPLHPKAELNVVYLPGYGKEKTSDGEFVNDIDVTLRFELTPSLLLIPAVYLIRQPTYHRNTYSVQLSWRI